ncbi:hypothetical protein B5E87_00225 [Massilimicrobiota sp. An142]|uniref:hypothetical protein n=1 Tax=Massilimicrobiota sp. An142 TaxID=1965564 RepID=UPI000B36DD35|nr:hypothetical protein [Massilimicrobiota sp. An142]OUQ15032.1 hypothetical protein B5E87_00225 [Massilimicrobiota sp. An142]
MKKRDERLIQKKKRLSNEYDSLFEKIVEILIKYRTEVKDWNYSELKKYNRLVNFDKEISNLLRDFSKEELEVVNEILVDEFKESWKETQSKIHKRKKMPEEKEIKKIVNYRNSNDGLSVEERNKRNVDYLSYKIHGTVVKNSKESKDFDKLINQDLNNLKKNHVSKTSTRQLQDDITQAESLGVMFLAASLNGTYDDVYNTVVNGGDYADVSQKKEIWMLYYITAGDGRVCSSCLEREGNYYPADGSFSIPDNTHPNCRCELLPELVENDFY